MKPQYNRHIGRNRNAIPAYKDKDLTNRPGEQWEDIPFVDGYYLISNYGRIKRLEREATGRKSSTVILPEKIIGSDIIERLNNYVHDYRYHLHASIQVDKTRYPISIARLVYYCFVEPFAMDDTYINIVFKNGNGLDVRPENLMMMQKNILVRKMIDTGRKPSVYNDKTRKKGALASLEITSKQTSQYNHKGELIKTYKSTMDASRATSLSQSQICVIANGRGLTAGGFYWRYGNAKKIDIDSLLEQRRQQYTKKRGAKVTQYDLDGNLIAHHLSLALAAEAIGAADYSGISRAIRGITKTAFGYRWKRGFNKTKLEPIKRGKK